MSEEEPTPEEQAILDATKQVVNSASDAMDMEGIYAIMIKLGLTLKVWRRIMLQSENPMPEAWVDQAAMAVWLKFFP